MPSSPPIVAAIRRMGEDARGRDGTSYHSGKQKEQRAVTRRYQVGELPLPGGVQAQNLSAADLI
jgi:hypothetical protein